MNDYIVVRHIALSGHHKPTGGTRHYQGNEPLPPPTQLQIMRYADDSGYYLLYLDAEGKKLTDTYHETLDEALAQATWEFGVEPSEWSLCIGN